MGTRKYGGKQSSKRKGTRRSSRLAKQKIVVGKIYADWCGHCKSLNGEWKKLKKMIKLGRGRDLKNSTFEFVELGDTPKNQEKVLLSTIYSKISTQIVSPMETKCWLSTEDTLLYLKYVITSLNIIPVIEPPKKCFHGLHLNVPFRMYIR